MKTCRKCNLELPYEQFRKRSDGKSDGYTSWCKPCQNEQSKARYATPEGKAAYLASKYKISTEEAVALTAREKCDSCGGPAPFKSLHVDHNHATGEVRGVLCHHCNTALGLMSDSPEKLRALALYAERSA